MIPELKKLFIRDLDKLTEEVELIPETLLWKAPSGVTNACGTLALHLCGNLRHFIGAVLGGTGYIRERDREFADRHQSISDILELISQTKTEVISTLDKIKPEDLAKNYPLQLWNSTFTVSFFLMHLHSHLQYHTGQLNYLRRLLFAD